MLKLGFIFVLNFFITASLVLNTNHSVGSRQFYTEKERWYDYSKKQINYRIDEGFSKQQHDYIKAQFWKITARTCLFTWDVGNKDCDSGCILISKGTFPNSCEPHSWSKDEIHLADECFKNKWVLHAIMHAIGFGHEHQRSDRNCYVTVSEDKLTDPHYQIDPNIDISFPYDVHSIMHYRLTDKLRPVNYTTIQPEEFGQWDELTEMNTIALNYMYCGGKHYCDINPERCQYFRCWIECNPCSDEPVNECKNCAGNTY